MVSTTLSNRLDLGDIQGDILLAYGNDYPFTSYLFVNVGGADGRGWLGGLVDRVTTALPWPKDSAGATIKQDTTLNLAFTASGLAALGVSNELLATFSAEFRAGMASRAADLGDVGASAPASWESGLGSGTAHVLATINAKRRDLLQRDLAAFRKHAEDWGVTVVNEQHAELLSGQREHFGFSDGFGQPAIEGVTQHKSAGGGVPEPGGRWRALAAGEFILGYEDEDSRYDPERRLPIAPAAPLGRSGTYMVYRKLHQDVALWRRTLRDAAHGYPGGPRRLAAKIVGRWPNGAPLVTSPDEPDADFDPSLPGSNDFRYLDHDADGARCPLGAHIRRTSPRDALGWKGLDDAGLLAFRHRIIRRGMPYGPPLEPDLTVDDGVDRGLVFVCFNASISRQFEGIALQWVNDGNAFHIGDDRDFLLGGASASGKMTIQGQPPYFVAAQPSLVTTKGGEYLFAPGMTALAALADATEAGL
ncbi:MAG TPA: Dyp-type peroxidase [Solirubrobacteraceae bacterium]|jgi:Dyp-type peroxidase family|nr:Dyp-type peroxidase [Solirubrobacteraceae bacterium]